MDIADIKEKLSEVEQRIAIREQEIKEDRAIVSYLKGYVVGIEFFRNNLQ